MSAFLRWCLCVWLFAWFACSSLAYDSKTLIENDRVRVVRIELPKDGELPSDNTMDVITIQLTEGRTSFIEPGQMGKTEPSGTGQVHYFAGGTRRSVKNLGKEAVSFVQIQFLRSPGKYVAFETPPSRYCNPDSPKACVREQYLFCTDRFCAESILLDPSAASTQHTHDADHMAVSLSDFTWREEIPGKPATDHPFKVGDAYYLGPGLTHELTNVGTTAARLFVIQFK